MTDSSQQEVLLKLWRAQKTKVILKKRDKFVFAHFPVFLAKKIHEYMIRNNTWNDTLQKLSWRIDSKTKSKNINEMNELTTIVELTVNKKDTGKSDIIRFEMDRDQLSSVLGQINDIKKHLTKFSSN